METQPTKCGYIGIIGLANAGKSTLLNACVGHKLAGVSSKPQTTRNRILGVRTIEDTQLLFLDSPGILKRQQKIALDEAMVNAIEQTIEDSDVLLYLIDVSRDLQPQDQVNLSLLKNKPTMLAKLMVIASKSDRLKKEQVQANLKIINAALAELDLPPARLFSAKSPSQIDELLQELRKRMPESPWFFDTDDLSDRSQNFIIAELIREQIFRQFSQEVPFSCTVKVDSLTQREKNASVSATIFTNKESHQPILIGKGGDSIRKIRQEAVQTLKRHLDCPVRLSLSVKTSTNWVTDPARVAGFLES